jgi:6-phosphogluconolactonase
VSGFVYAQTNDADANEAIAFRRGDDGRLEALGRHATGGRGTGKAHLPSQGSVTLSGDGRFLLVTNGGSGDVTVFRVDGGGLELAGTTPSGDGPVSIAEHSGLVYVLNNGGDGEITGFRLSDDSSLAPVADSRRPLSSAGADGAQIAFTPDGRWLVVTERATDGISAYAIGDDGRAEGPQSHRSAGATPYGFDFTPDGVLVVTEAFGAQVGKAAASSYSSRLDPISSSVGSGRSEVCWAAVTKDGRFVYVTNFGDGTISSYRIGGDGSIELLDPIAATTVEGSKGVRDEALTGDGRFLYALDADARKVFGFEVRPDGSLDALGAADGLPATVAGLAAS